MGKGKDRVPGGVQLCQIGDPGPGDWEGGGTGFENPLSHSKIASEGH